VPGKLVATILPMAAAAIVSGCATTAKWVAPKIATVLEVRSVSSTAVRK
jgi:hypothetical protein